MTSTSGRNLERLALSALLVPLALVSMPQPGGEASACVGKTIVVGAPDTVEDRLLANLVSVLVNERTGTTVKVQAYADGRRVLEAVKERKVAVVVENTDHALRMLGVPPTPDPRKAYDEAKKGYRKLYGLVWLRPFGVLAAGPQGQRQYGPVLTTEVMRNYPALPRLVNKLAGIDAAAFAEMAAAVRRGEEPKTVAHRYLAARRLI